MEKNSPALVAGVDVVRLADDIAEQEGTSCEREDGEDLIIHALAVLLLWLRTPAKPRRPLRSSDDGFAVICFA